MPHEPETVDLFDKLCEAGGWWHPQTCPEKCWQAFERLSRADQVLAVMAARIKAGDFERENYMRCRPRRKPQTKRPALHNWLKNRRFMDDAKTLLDHPVWAVDVSEVAFLREEVAALRKKTAWAEHERDIEMDQRRRAVQGLGALSDLIEDAGLCDLDKPLKPGLASLGLPSRLKANGLCGLSKPPKQALAPTGSLGQTGSDEKGDSRDTFSAGNGDEPLSGGAGDNVIPFRRLGKCDG
jgi:hypothetical protein